MGQLGWHCKLSLTELSNYCKSNFGCIKSRSPRHVFSLIYGFVSKDVAHTLLIERPNGTFLLRFSENYIEKSSMAEICGRITVAVKKENSQTGETNTSTKLIACHLPQMYGVRWQTKGPFKCYVMLFPWKIDTRTSNRNADNINPYTFVPIYFWEICITQP